MKNKYCILRPKTVILLLTRRVPYNANCSLNILPYVVYDVYLFNAPASGAVTYPYMAENVLTKRIFYSVLEESRRRRSGQSLGYEDVHKRQTSQWEGLAQRPEWRGIKRKAHERDKDSSTRRHKLQLHRRCIHVPSMCTRIGYVSHLRVHQRQPY